MIGDPIERFFLHSTIHYPHPRDATLLPHPPSPSYSSLTIRHIRKEEKKWKRDRHSAVDIRLQDVVLLLRNEKFYDFVIQVAGKMEAEILKIQGIRIATAFLQSVDPLAIFRLECDAVAEPKEEAFWQCNDGRCAVKHGIESNLQILADTLKEKHNKYVKKIQQRQKAAQPVMTTSVTNFTGTHGSSDHLLSEVLSTSSVTSLRTVPSEEMAQSYASSVSTPPLSTGHI
jgi:hypothetical protein